MSSMNPQTQPSQSAKTSVPPEAASESSPKGKGRSPQVISNPNDVASLVLMQIDAVNARKDDLTIAVKALTDTTKQLVRAYAGHAQTIARLQKRVEELEGEIQE